MTNEAKIRNIAAVAAREFKIKGFKELVVVDELDGAYGICHPHGLLEIRVKRVRGDAYLSRNTIIDTLAHELAHLDTWEHGKAHRRLTTAIKVWLERNWK